MDIFVPIIMCIIIFLIFSFCGWCCKRKREGVILGGPAVTVTQTIDPGMGPGFAAAPTIQPYPQVAPYPQPYPAAPYQTTPYPPAAYYPPPMGPVPPYPVPPSTGMQPPSYNEAIAHPNLPAAPPIAREGYVKQSPYNPNF